VPRWALALIVVVLAVLAVSQLVLPQIAENDVEDRLTEGGGQAQVSVSSVPAARLFFDDGERFEVRASGLDLDLDQRTKVLDRLDGFGEVDVAIDDFIAGPLEIDSFELTRDGSGPYRLVSSSRASAAALVDFGADELGLPGGGILGGLAGQALGNRKLPLDLDMELTSDGGTIEVVSGGGTVAGIPTGPLGEVITEAIVARL
jgi:hypothetical protein